MRDTGWRHAAAPTVHAIETKLSGLSRRLVRSSIVVMFQLFATSVLSAQCELTLNQTLGKWVGVQRTKQSKGRLSQERIQRLDDLGFVWNSNTAAWEEMFAALVEYKNLHGDCNVPSRFISNPQLGQWVMIQRKAKRKNKINSNRLQRLEGLGFVWNSNTAAWEEMFAALKDYQSQHGHCNVPARWTQNPSLGMWAHTQRKTKNKGALSEQRTRRLEALGFEWTKR
jgi:hypothetical protein